MVRTLKTFLTAFAVFLVSAPLFAAPDHIGIRTLGGMEPIGRLSASGMDLSGGDLVMDTGYGFSTGLEIYVPLGERVEVGGGFRWQAMRPVYRSGGDSDGKFGYLPVYAAGRVVFMELDDFSLYGLAKAGYGFFRTASAFNEILDAGDGGPIVSVSGGLYLTAGMGVKYALKDRPKWGLDLSVDAGYSFHGARGEAADGDTHRFHYQTMTADFGMDWRF